jgi:hypothetical protein
MLQQLWQYSSIACGSWIKDISVQLHNAVYYRPVPPVMACFGVPL